MTPSQTRCSYFEKPALMRDFHDHEWGEPVIDAAVLFEYLVLHTFGVGIGMKLVMQKREHFRNELAGFSPERLARFGPNQVEELVENPRMIRNRCKIEATITNAKAWLQLADELGGEAYILPFFYDFVGGKPVDNQRTEHQPPLLTTPAAEAMSAALKERDFVLIGSVTCYGIMQTAGLVNDHAITCYRHQICAEMGKK